eukprot:1265661-Lingulodinium_polyedra.AAC.1
MSSAKLFHNVGYVWATLGSPMSSAKTPSGTLEMTAAWTTKLFPFCSRRLKPLRNIKLGRSSCMMNSTMSSRPMVRAATKLREQEPMVSHLESHHCTNLQALIKQEQILEVRSGKLAASWVTQRRPSRNSYSSNTARSRAVSASTPR